MRGVNLWLSLDTTHFLRCYLFKQNFVLTKIHDFDLKILMDEQKKYYFINIILGAFFYIFYIKSKSAWTFFFSFWLLTAIQSCAMDAPEKGYEYLAPPVITDVRLRGDNIVVDFYGYNDEYYFDGYNVYADENSMKRNSVASYKPVQIVRYASSAPSFPLSPDDYDPDVLRTIELYHHWKQVDVVGEYIQFQFEENTTYYILICAHHRFAPPLEESASNIEKIEFHR